MISTDQRQFIKIFVCDGEYNLMTTCAAVGILPSVALVWFRDDKFQSELRRYEGAQLASMGYGPLRVMRDTLAIAHSDLSQVTAYAADLHNAPYNVRIAIKKIKMGIAVVDGEAVPYAKEIEMHDKTWALKQAAEWFEVRDAPEVQKTKATSVEDGPKRITGLIVRPPLTQEEKDLEDLLG